MQDTETEPCTEPSERDASDDSLTHAENEEGVITKNEVEREEEESIVKEREEEAENKEEEQDGEEDEDDDGGWITCKNIKKHKNRKNFFGAPEEEEEEEKDVKVACITGDFAVQVSLVKGSQGKVGK